MNPLRALAVVLAAIAFGYGLANAGKVSAEWMLANGCYQVAFTKENPDANGMVKIEENSTRFLCEGGRLVE